MAARAVRTAGVAALRRHGMMLRGAQPFLRAARHRFELQALAQRRWASDVPKIDPYEIMDVEPGASIEVIKEQYRELVKENHPDLNPHADPHKLAEINEAYALLMREREGKERVTKGNQPTDEPPVLRSELHERVYKPAEQKWEEATTMQMLKIKRRYGTVAYYVTRAIFIVVQFLRMYRFLVGIMLLGLGFQIFRGWLAQREAARMAQLRAKKSVLD
eukprot:TRINITY_DN36830_c0_g1_i1.p1 TRINITY_DN36830_c0_g1~~TRINITY_DN36830_c0_g1_i1.p1  ORF type:complete len:235 (+),score=76.59 TRINITY_DN36830_c0_g1_i1:53-706(+)